MRSRIILAVTNDLSSDQRVQRTCRTLVSMGAEVTFVGRKLRESTDFNPPGYKIHRFRLWFRKGAAFYTHYQIRLFFYLLFHPFDVVVANDLDTLWPSAWASKWKGKKLVYDSHEFFTGVPEIQNKPAVLRIWRWIEKRFYHCADAHITVNDSIAKLLEETYGGKRPVVVRNIGEFPGDIPILSRGDLALPEDRFIAINQGAGINVERGMEETIEAISNLEGLLLLIVGDGDVVPKLKQMIKDKSLGSKVMFVPRQPYAKLLAYTRLADLGLSLDKATSVNYTFSLPNKLFDYLQSGLPVLTSEVVEVKKIVDQYDVGLTIDSSRPDDIARGLKTMMERGKSHYAEAVDRAARALNWNQERKVLESVFRPLIKEQK